jgi:hypothetical protein
MSAMGWLQDVVSGIAIAGQQRRTQEVEQALIDGVILGFDIIAQVGPEHPGAEIEELLALSAGHPRAAHLDPWTRSVVISNDALKCGLLAARIMADDGAKFEGAEAQSDEPSYAILDEALHIARGDRAAVRHGHLDAVLVTVGAGALVTCSHPKVDQFLLELRFPVEVHDARSTVARSVIAIPLPAGARFTASDPEIGVCVSDWMAVQRNIPSASGAPIRRLEMGPVIDSTIASSSSWGMVMGSSS